MMLPSNRSSFRQLLHSVVGAAWYFHVIVLVVAHLLLAGISVYHHRLLHRLPLHPLQLATIGSIILTMTAVIRAVHYSVAPYAITIEHPPATFLVILTGLDHCADILHLVNCSILMTCLIILFRHSTTSILFIQQIPTTLFLVVNLLISITTISTSIFVQFSPHLQPIPSLFMTIHGFSLSIIGGFISSTSLSSQPCILPISFNFYSSSSTSSNSPSKSPNLPPNLYYECHSGLPRSMTKTSLEEYFTPFPNNTRNIHINDLEIIVELQEPINKSHQSFDCPILPGTFFDKSSLPSIPEIDYDQPPLAQMEDSSENSAESTCRNNETAYCQAVEQELAAGYTADSENEETITTGNQINIYNYRLAFKNPNLSVFTENYYNVNR